MNESIQNFSKNIFRVECESMNPTLEIGDLAVYEPIKPNYGFHSSIYLIEENGVKKVRTVQFLIKGGINIIKDSDRSFKKIENEELHKIIFLGHITSIIKKDREVKRFRLFG